MPRVLVIEDDETTAREIVAELSVHGMTAEWVANGREGLERARQDGYDLITLDRMLPGLDGIDVVAELRRAQVDTPVLMISALSDVDERVRGLRAGGDDYMTKPFAFDELRARVEALLRRSPEPRETVLRLDDLELDLLSRSARRGRRVLDLLPRELQILEYLMRHEGQTVTRAMLFERVWGYRFDPRTNLVDVHVGRLRRKIDGVGETPLFETVRGIGFALHAART